ncbi:hypothetical protein PoB_001649900 [Plakobranchus ocellatus]|uniref:Uncharacterized protein n=1 Tax=Plakobranchus ocellatus TaxID=259542 RepID=A0AAV3Z7M3_9GAST|nr:hypothetical protein PoB_001649900 [Plakobranchus ocellatus]
MLKKEEEEDDDEDEKEEDEDEDKEEEEEDEDDDNDDDDDDKEEEEEEANIKEDSKADSGMTRACLLRSPDLVPGFPADFHDDGVPVKDEEFLGNLPGCDNEDLPGTS